MKDKLTKCGFKLFVLTDGQSGCTWNFFVYRCKSDTPQTEGLSYTSVMNLMKFDLLGKGYHLYVDNFYTSWHFSTRLQPMTRACGTMRQTWIGCPKTKENDLPKKAERGEMRWLRKDDLLLWNGRTQRRSQCAAASTDPSAEPQHTGELGRVDSGSIPTLLFLIPLRTVTSTWLSWTYQIPSSSIILTVRRQWNGTRPSFFWFFWILQLWTDMSYINNWQLDNHRNPCPTCSFRMCS